MKKFMVYMDDGKDCFKAAVPAENEQAARKYVEGNGEVIAVKDVSAEWWISLDKIAQALDYTYQYTRELHGHALQNFQRTYKII